MGWALFLTLIENLMIVFILNSILIENVMIIMSIESNFLEKLVCNEEEKLNQTKTLLKY
jgi:hypothetical protein